MKLLDRAFIKAYELEDTGSSVVPVTPHSRRDAVPEAAPVMAVSDGVSVTDTPVQQELSEQIPGFQDTGAWSSGWMTDIEIPELPEPAIAESPAVQALLQVDRFNWPEICVSLSAAQSEFKSLADELAKMVATGKLLVAITSRYRGEGRTTFMMTIARLAAMQGCRVAIVDADFQNAQLARQLGILPEAGWEDVLSGRLPLPEVLIESVGDKVALLPLRSPVQKPETLTRGPRTGSTLSALRNGHQLVLVDVGALAERSRDRMPVLTAAGFDAAILVRDMRMTSNTELADAAKRLTDAGIPTYGVAENFISAG